MKKILFALLFLAVPAFATVTLSPGQSTSVECVSVGTVVVVPPPVPPVVVPPAGSYVASGLWLPGQSRLTTGTLSQARPAVEGPFTIPTGWVGIVEFPVSGANLNIRVDGVLTSSDGRPMSPGPHTLRVEITSMAQEASGSVDVVHTPK